MSLHERVGTPGRLGRRALIIPLLMLPTGIARPQTGGESGAQETKVVPIPRSVEDVKRPWVGAPAKSEEVQPAETVAQPLPQERELPLSSSSFRAPDLADRVLFDEPGDGALWALGGRSYKARFDSELATYFPRFGAHVSGQHPLSFALEEVLVGGERIELARGVPYERAGSVVLYDRGSLVEFYELRPESMEQKFLFEELPEELPIGGDLVLHIAAETELAVLETAAGFELANEHGRIGYSRALTLDSRGRAGETTTSFVGGRIEIRVAASFLAEAAWPITIDPVVTTFGIDVDATANAYHPDLAYDATQDRYGVVWEQAFTATDRDVFSLLLNANGSIVPGSEVALDVTSHCWTKPKVANNALAVRFLTVCETSDDCASPFLIEGRSRSAAGNALGSQFLVSVGLTGDKIDPDVGGDAITEGPTYYCVVWERVWSDTDHDVHYQLVRTDDTLLFPSTQLVDNTPGTLDLAPAISKSNGQRPFSKQNWTVVWARKVGTLDNDIHGAQIRWDGALTHPTFAVDTSSAADAWPRVSTLLPTASGEREYMVVFHRGAFSGARVIMARIMRGSTALTSTTNLTEVEGPDSWSQDDLYPDVDADSDCFAVLHSE